MDTWGSDGEGCQASLGWGCTGVIKDIVFRYFNGLKSDQSVAEIQLAASLEIAVRAGT